MIHVIATVDLAAGTRDAFLAEFHKVMPLVRAEQGCLAYGPCVDAGTCTPSQSKVGPDRVTIVEQWESVDALKAHAVAPQMKTYRADVKDFVRGMDPRVLSNIGEALSRACRCRSTAAVGAYRSCMARYVRPDTQGRPIGNFTIIADFDQSIS